jgi:ABC-type sulfate transport system permease component
MLIAPKRNAHAEATQTLLLTPIVLPTELDGILLIIASSHYALVMNQTGVCTLNPHFKKLLLRVLVANPTW